MKRIIIIMALIMPLIAIAQESKLDSFFNKYSGQEGYSSVYITQYMFDLLKKVNNAEEEKEYDDITSHLTGIKILTVSEGNSARKDAFLKKLNELLPEDQYKKLMVVKEGKETITFLIKENGEKISEFVMKIEEGNEPGIILLEGDMTLRQISQLSGKMDVKGFEHLNELENENHQ